MKKLLSLLVILPAFLLAGCMSFPVKFENVSYMINAKRHNYPATVVISKKTMTDIVPIRAAMGGLTNKWDVKAGSMLQQVSKIEFPQMFSHVTYTTTNSNESYSNQHLTFVMSIAKYQFIHNRATISIHFKVYNKANKVILNKTYTASGNKHTAAMFFGGAFAMKSALRESSLEAFKIIFKNMRTGLNNANMNKPIHIPMHTIKVIAKQKS